jgi:aldehyde:ferredoxin oxidoreductase
MQGWTGVFLNVNLTNKTASAECYDADLALNFLGGRGFAAKTLWDHLKPGNDPLSPDNLLIFASGPLTGIGLPNSGKLVVASKSPLTGGYGDGNIGTLVAVHMRKAGYDAIILGGKAPKPSIVYINDQTTEFLDAQDYWRTTSFETEQKLRRKYGRTVGIVSIGQAGENLAKFATVVSQEGRAGGRPGMGAVMGSKNLKAIVVEGSQPIPLANPDEMKQLAIEGYREVLSKPLHGFWKPKAQCLQWNGAKKTVAYRPTTTNTAPLKMQKESTALRWKK